MQELKINKEILFSELLRELEHGNRGNTYLCHAAEDLVYHGEYRWWCDDTATHAELLRIMPGYIKVNDAGTLYNWVKNMPSHLAGADTKKLSVSKFRIKFLKWAIKKFGDQPINFSFSRTGYDGEV